ncbi:MAG: hypothetical protein HYV63_16055 [Candidatus Schekmanbacteria bacterium]|nr:hypothetical protein [Candidatus Schekmanbacteria bacterium]
MHSRSLISRRLSALAALEYVGELRASNPSLHHTEVADHLCERLISWMRGAGFGGPDA